MEGLKWIFHAAGNVLSIKTKSSHFTASSVRIRCFPQSIRIVIITMGLARSSDNKFTRKILLGEPFLEVEILNMGGG